MLRTITILALCPLVSAQQFEVASIKPSGSDTHSSSGIKTGHGRLDANNVTLKRCIIGAYGVGPHQIAGGPDWINSDRFQISAKAERPTEDDALMMTMLQALLADRFKLVIQRETRTMPAFVLEVAKNGPKLDKTEPGEASTNTVGTNGAVSIDARYTSMDSFARVLARQLDLPVVNRTGLDGVFSIRLHWSSDTSKPGDGGATEAVSIFTAIQEQLGLRLRAQKAPVEMLVITHAEKPSEN